MPLSNRSFADKHSRAQSLHNAIALFVPVFSPSASNLAANEFQTFINEVEINNDAVSTAEAELTPLSDGRVADARELRAMALRVKDHVKANLLWKKHARAIGAAADAVRGYRPTKKAAAPSPEAGSVPPKPKRRGSGPQYSYANLAKLFAKLITRLTKITGYVAMTGSGLTIAELSAQKAAFSALNDTISTAETDLSEARRIRKESYDGDAGLRVKMKCIKHAVRSQYGPASPQFTAVRTIAP